MTGQIEIVLPLKPHNGQRGSDLARARHALLASFDRFCDPAFIARFTIVAPRVDLPAIALLQSSTALELTLMAEEDLLKSPPAMPRHGWYVQQMIKIAYAGICRTRFYLTLDADILLTAPLHAQMIDADRAPMHPEPVSAHTGWWQASAATLGFPSAATDTPEMPVCGVTPAFIAAPIMRAVIRRLTLHAEAAYLDWPDYLAARTTSDETTWTEYALYWTQLLNTADPARVHISMPLYRFCHSVCEAEAGCRPGATALPFCVLQSSYVDQADHVAFARHLLGRSGPPA